MANPFDQYGDAVPLETWGEYASGLGRAGAQGLTFGFADEIEAGVRAPFSDQSYSEIRNDVRGQNAEFTERHPNQALAAEIAGGLVVPGLGAAGAVRTGANVGKAVTGALASRAPQAVARTAGTVAGGATGGAIVGAPTGALYGAGASESEGMDRLKDAVKGAGVGAVTGGAVGGVAIPAVAAVGRGAKAIAEPYVDLVRAMRNPEREGARRVATSFMADAGKGLDDTAFAAAEARGQPVLNFERGGTNTRDLARVSGNLSGEARETLEDALDPRFASQNERTADFLQTLGPGSSSMAAREALEKEARSLTAPPYRKAMNDGRDGIDSIELQDLAKDRPALKGPIRQAADTMKNRAGIDPETTGMEGKNGLTLEYWDAVKRHLDDDISTAEARGEKSTMRDLIGIKEKLVGILDKSVPSYEGARQTASGFFGASNALEAGEKFATAGARYGNAEARKEIAKFSGRERDLFAEGYLSRLTDNAGEFADRRNIANDLANSPGKRERVEMALGPQRAKELNDQLGVEQLMERNRKEVSGNSTTARQLIQAAIANPLNQGALGAGGYTLLTGDTRGLAIAGILAGARAGAGAANRVAANQVSLEVAKLLTSKDPAKIQEAMKRIANSPTMMENLRRYTGAAVGGVTAAQNAKEPKKDPLASALRRSAN